MIIKTDDEWKKILTPEQYQVLRQKGTEAPGTGQYDHNFEPGTYVCAACQATLFISDHKFEAGCGWPSFDRPADNKNVVLEEDNNFGTHRTEVLCRACGGHLGHVFPDGPTDTGQRYCINSASLGFKRAD